jgi:hypothetical protein
VEVEAAFFWRDARVVILSAAKDLALFEHQKEPDSSLRSE